MADQSTSEPVVPLPPATEGGERKDQLDLAGKNILSLLHKSTGLAKENSRYAIRIAQRLSDQLCTAENRVEELEARITELEAEVKFYRDKSEKAELWLDKISNEIQERVVGSHN
jgi:CII-binding regulator of phage lambda lysogenization HflD